jgi:hypothetical protein
VEEDEVEEEAVVALVYHRRHRFSIPQTRRPMLLPPQSQPLPRRPFPRHSSSHLARKCNVYNILIFSFEKQWQRLHFEIQHLDSII